MNITKIRSFIHLVRTALILNTIGVLMTMIGTLILANNSPQIESITADLVSEPKEVIDRKNKTASNAIYWLLIGGCVFQVVANAIAWIDPKK